MTLKKIRLTACLLGAVLGAVCSSSAYSFTVLQACDLCTSPSLPAAIQECCKCVKVCDPEGTPNPAFQSCVVNHEICPALVIERSAVFMAMPYCGNGKVEAGESCDDGKQCEDGQKACTSATDCTGIGSGTCATRDGDSCPATCVIQYKAATTLAAQVAPTPYCGNAVVETGESCDDGKQCEDGQKACTSATDCTGIGSGTCATRDGDSCPSTCRIEYKAATEYQAVYTAPEARPTLQAATEYQAVYTAPEARPTLQAVTGYRAVYKLPSQCGNGSVDTAAGEQCDPKAPNDPNAPYCTSECKIDECLKTSVDTASVAYQCCKAYRYPETQTSRKTFECCVANKGLLSAEQVNACLSATATTPVAYTREIAFLASPKTAEPAKTISVSAAYEAPAVTDIPWVEQMLPQEKTAVLGRKVALPTAGDDLTPPPPPDTQPADKCLEDFPDVNSQGYNCCKEYRPTRKIISRELRGTARPLANYFECCMAPENTDGVLDQAEIQACECKSRPDEPLCNCLGAHQADFLNGCLAASGSTDKFTFVPEPPTYVYDLGGLNSKLGNRLKITLPACACAAPQTFQAPDDACGAIGNQRGFRVHDFPCLYPDQVKKAGYPAETVPEGYRITAPMSSDECVRLGGSAVSKVPAVIEGQTQNDVAVAALTAVDRADYLPVDRVSETQPANEVTCTFVKPACPCTPPPPPETQPETAPEEPPPPAPTTPEAKVAPEFRMAISGWGDSHAVLMDTAEVISLREATPELPRQAITSEAAFRLYKAYAEYDKNPNPENLAKLRAVVNENILGEVKETPHYGLMLLTPPPKDREDEGAAAVEADFAAIRAQFVKKAIELNPADGRLKVNAPEALEVLRSNAAALAADGEPEIVSMSQLFKTVSASGQPPIIEITVDAAQVSGGGCSLLR